VWGGGGGGQAGAPLLRLLPLAQLSTTAAATCPLPGEHLDGQAALSTLKPGPGPNSNHETLSINPNPAP
jgi:hypothetical protein